MRTTDMRSVRSRLFKAGSHVIVIVLSVIICLWMTSGAKAGFTKLSDVRFNSSSTHGDSIELKFNGVVNKDDVRLSFDRNFIQLELNGISAFPAVTKRFPKSKTVNKAFAYQFNPQLARVRLFVQGKASRLTEKTVIEYSGNSIRIQLGMAGKVSDAAFARTASVNRKSNSLTSDERALLQELKSTKAKKSKAQKETPLITKVAPEGDLFTSKKDKANTTGIAQKKRDKKASLTDGVIRLILSLLVVSAVIGTIAYALKKGGFGKSLTPAKPLSTDVIKTLGNHTLAPNRSLMVVKIVDEIVVLGVTDQSINHVMNLAPDADFALEQPETTEQVSFGQFKRMIQTKISSKNNVSAKA